MRLTTCIAIVLPLLLVAPAARANYTTGEFQPGRSWYVDPISGSLGIGSIAPAATTIVVDSDGDAVPDTVYDLPSEIRPDGMTPSYFMEYRLSPLQRVLYAKKFGGAGVGCPGPDQVRIYLFGLDGAPTMNAFTNNGICIDGPLGLGPRFYENPAELRQTMALAGNVLQGLQQQVLWADLAGRVLQLDATHYDDGVIEVLYSPSGNAAMVLHGYNVSSGRYTFVDLCASPIAAATALSSPTSYLSSQHALVETGGSTGFQAVLRIDTTLVMGSEFPLDISCCPSSQLQACCYDDGACPVAGEVTPAACEASGGTPGGPDTECDTFQCPEPCCMPDVGCQLLTPVACTAAGGSAQGPGMSCSMLSCATGNQACCQLDGGCNLATPTVCVQNLHGSPAGAGSTCGGSTCPVLMLSVSVSGPAIVERGADVEYTIDYGNTGDLVTGATVEAYLGSATFLSASAGGTFDGTRVVWQVGTLVPGSGGQVTVRATTDCQALSAGVYVDIVSTLGPSFFASPATTTLFEGSPLGISVASTPRVGPPVEGGGIVDHVITLTNPDGVARNGLRIPLLPGDGMTFDAVADAGTGAAMLTPERLDWAGSLPAGGSTSVEFSTVADGCIDLRETRLVSAQPLLGTDVVVWGGCDQALGSARADTLALRRAVEIDVTATNLLPPQRMHDQQFKPNVQLARTGAEVEFQVLVHNPHATAIPAASFGYSLPNELVEGSPVLIDPVAPGVTYDPVLRRISWSGSLGTGETLTIGFRATPTSFCSVSVVPSAGDGTCNVTDWLLVPRVPPRPPEPRLLGLAGNSVYAYRPGIDASASQIICIPSSFLSGFARRSNGEIWVAAGTLYRFNQDTLEFSEFHPDVLADQGIPWIAELAGDPTDGSMVLMTQEQNEQPVYRLQRFFPGSAQAAPIYEGPEAQGQDVVVNSRGEIFVNGSYGTNRFDPTPPVMPSPSSGGWVGDALALDADETPLLGSSYGQEIKIIDDGSVLVDLYQETGNPGSTAALAAANNGDIYLYYLAPINTSYRVERSPVSVVEMPALFPEEIFGMEFDRAGVAPCLDLDGDGAFAGPGCAAGTPADCDDNDPSLSPLMPEVNDFADNNCDGAVDEVSGPIGFDDPLDPAALTWVAQGGATEYEVARSDSPTFDSFAGDSCVTAITADTFWSDPDAPPPPDGVFYYLVRPTSPFGGSWGLQTSGATPAERNVVCF